MPPLAPDDPRTVGGYLLLRRLGAGGMGRVYLARSPGGRPVAVKVVRSELADDAGFRRRFRREVDAARRVSGVYTAPLVDADPDAVHPWLATAYVAGPSLQEAVERHGPFAERSLRVLAAGLTEALRAIHAAGLVHRDLKPSNVLLSSDGPRVIDFGISRAVDATALTGTGHVIGSPAFMSPEQAEGRATGPESDIFSLGSVLGFAAMGRSPFGEGLPSALMYRIVHTEPDLGGIPEGLAGVIRACLAKEPERRPSIDDLLRSFAIREPDDERSWLPEPVSDELRSRVEDLTVTLAQAQPPEAPPHADPSAPTVPEDARAASPSTSTTPAGQAYPPGDAGPSGSAYLPTVTAAVPSAAPPPPQRRGLFRARWSIIAAMVAAGLLIGGAAAWLSGGSGSPQAGSSPTRSPSGNPSRAASESPASSTSADPSSGTAKEPSDGPSGGASRTGTGRSSQNWDVGEISPFVGVWEAHSASVEMHSNGVFEYRYRTYVDCAEAEQQGRGPVPCDSVDPAAGVIEAGGRVTGAVTDVDGNTARGKWGSGNPDIRPGSEFVMTYDPEHDAIELEGVGIFCGPEAPPGWCGA